MSRAGDSGGADAQKVESKSSLVRTGCPLGDRTGLALPAFPPGLGETDETQPSVTQGELSGTGEMIRLSPAVRRPVCPLRNCESGPPAAPAIPGRCEAGPACQCLWQSVAVSGTGTVMVPVTVTVSMTAVWPARPGSAAGGCAGPAQAAGPGLYDQSQWLPSSSTCCKSPASTGSESIRLSTV